MILFENFHVGSSYLHSPVYLQGIQVRFVYEGRWVKLTVTWATKHQMFSHHPYT